MSLDRRLIDAIKGHFARKSAAQLEAVVRGDDPDRWSAEAAAAAGEVLHDRRAGLAREPEVPEEEEPPEVIHYAPEDMALGVLAMLFTGSLYIRYTVSAQPGRDLANLPVPFGQKMAWLAVESTNTRAVAAALGLRRPAEEPWATGIEAAHRGSVFVTPPVGDWTLAVGTPLFPTPDGTAAFVPSLLDRLGRRFADVQFFCNHADVGLYAWGRARKGRLVRGYGWLGARSRLLWELGPPTKAEQELGFRFEAGRPPQVEKDDAGGLAPFTEEALFQLASFWSIDPTTLDGEYEEPRPGLLGRL